MLLGSITGHAGRGRIRFKADDVVLGIETVVTAVEMKGSSVTILIVLLLDSDHHHIAFVSIHGSNCDKEGKF